MVSAAFVLTAVATFLIWRHMGPSIKQGQCQRCNVILISIDSVRADHMSLYGYSRDTTPNIARWATGASVFENYFATSYLTPISEGSVHTGLHPEANGVISFRHEFSPEIQTMAEVFRTGGYRTMALGNSPEFHNFPSLQRSFSRGFDTYNIDDRRTLNNRSLNWKALRRMLRKEERPFFLWLSLGVAHAPFGYLTKKKFEDKNYQGPFRYINFFMNMQYYFDGWIYNILDSQKAFRLLGVKDDKVATHRFPEDKFKTQKWPLKTTPADLQYIIDSYDNGVSQADLQVGHLIQLLESLDLTKESVIIVQSEHGETLGERGYIAHYDIWEESIHVPLIIASPALKGPNRIKFLVSGVDLLPSLMEHVGLAARPAYPLDGRTFIEAGEFKPVRNEVYFTRTPLWESVLKTDDRNSIFDRFRTLDDKIGFKDHGIRSASAKLIHRTARLAEEQFSCWSYISGKKITRPEYEFYDLEIDKAEKHPGDLSSPQAKMLQEKLTAFEAEMKDRARLTAQEPLVQDYQ